MSPRIASDDEACKNIEGSGSGEILERPPGRSAKGQACCAELLAGESDALEAVIKVLPALESNTVKVFLNYKEKR